MENIVEELNQKADQAKEEARRRGQRVMDEGKNKWESASNWIKQSPAEAVGYALAAGVIVGGVIGALSARRGRSYDALDTFTSWGQEGLREGIKPLRSAADRGLGALCSALEEIRSSLRRA